MSDFRISSTNHTSFTVSNLDRSLTFFRDGLGFEVTSKAPRDPQLIERITGVKGAQIMVAYVRGPDHALELIEYSAPATRTAVYPQPCDTGFAHIAFNVKNLDAALAAAARYEVMPIAAPVAIDAGPNKGRRVVYLRDPDGITIEFIEAV